MTTLTADRIAAHATRLGLTHLAETISGLVARAEGEHHRCPERNVRADALDEFVFDHVRAAVIEPAVLLAGEQAVALTQPVPDDELLAAELARLDRRIDSAAAEKRRLVDLFQAGLIDMPELQRRSSEVTARHAELAAKRTALAAERTALAPGDLLRRRVTDFAKQICGVIDQLDRPQRQQLMRLLIEAVHVTGSHVQIQLRIPLDPPDPGSRRRPDKPTPKPPPAHEQCQAKTVCVPLVSINGPSYRLKDRMNLIAGTSTNGGEPLPS